MGLIPEDIIRQVIDRCDIVETIASYIPLKRAGRNFKANCPFHEEKSPSFIVNPEKQIYHCFGCGVGGNVVSFVMKQERLEFPEAVRELAKKVNIEIPVETSGVRRNDELREQIIKANELTVEFFHANLLNDTQSSSRKAREYLKARGVTLDSVKRFKLGFAFEAWDSLYLYLKSQKISPAVMEMAGLVIARDKGDGHYDRFRNRLMFPIFDARGVCRAMGGRTLGDDAAKYMNSPETPIYTKGQHLYGFYLAKDTIVKEDNVVVVEGYMDCLMPHQAGVTNVVASLGTALTIEQIRLLRRYTTNVTMLYDMDPAGLNAMIRSFDILIEEGMNVTVANLTDGDDPDSFIRKQGAEAFRDRLKNAQSIFDFKLGFLQKTISLKGIEGKAKIAQEMLTTIRKFPNAVVRQGYIDKLSQHLGINERALNEELDKVNNPIQPKQNLSVKGNTQDLSHITSLEVNLLKLVLLDQEFVSAIKSDVDINEFQDNQVRQIFNKIFEIVDAGQNINLGVLVNCLNDPQAQQMVTGLMATDEIIGDKQRLYKDFIARIKTRKVKIMRQDLLAQISEAERNGDHIKLDELKTRFNNLTKVSI